MGGPDEAPAGLTSAEARRLLDEVGPNSLAEETRSWPRGLLAKLWAPVPWLLVIAALLAFNATLGLLQESRAGAALTALKKWLAPTALVRRHGEWTRLPAADLVPGDAIRLPLGSLCPPTAGSCRDPSWSSSRC